MTNSSCMRVHYDSAGLLLTYRLFCNLSFLQHGIDAILKIFLIPANTWLYMLVERAAKVTKEEWENWSDSNPVEGEGIAGEIVESGYALVSLNAAILATYWKGVLNELQGVNWESKEKCYVFWKGLMRLNETSSLSNWTWEDHRQLISGSKFTASGGE